MNIPVNTKNTLPVTKAAYEKGTFVMSEWRQYRIAGGEYSSATFNAVCAGRLRVPEIEKWLIENGYKKSLKEAQKNHESLHKERKAANG